MSVWVMLWYCRSHAVYKLLGVRKIATSSYHPKWQWWTGACELHDGPNAGKMVVNELQKNWDEQLPQFPYSTTIRSALPLI